MRTNATILSNAYIFGDIQNFEHWRITQKLYYVLHDLRGFFLQKMAKICPVNNFYAMYLGHGSESWHAKNGTSKCRLTILMICIIG